MTDQMVGTHAIAKLHGLTRIKWDAPQFAWALPWDKNSMVGPIVPPAGPTGSGSGGGSPLPPPAPPGTRSIFDLIGD
jgi:hypothetical protein